MQLMNEITSSQTFSLTPSAGARIATLLTSEAAPYFRVSVDG
ncbi:MAG TPA: iron-sulfur cluster assembly accessory protein, partial [Alphaproteobacteria bacterium]|nr:iron-sulfur cluster assembly accessory protein [Alphaproteobacteria bacterium]